MHNMMTDSLRRDDLRRDNPAKRKPVLRQRYLITWTTCDSPDLQVSRRHYPLRTARKIVARLSRRHSINWTGLDSFKAYM